jgi:hypothetical protein
MANITPEANYIQIEETRFRAPVSEATLTRMGASINFLLDKVPFNVQKIEFLSNTTWTAPQNAIFGIVEGVGGGGGGGCGSTSSSGGGGSSGFYFERPLSIVPNQNYSVVIGAGGAGSNSPGVSGGNGGNSQFGSVIFFGGLGGDSSQSAINNPSEYSSAVISGSLNAVFQRMGFGRELISGSILINNEIFTTYAFFRRPLGGGLLGSIANNYSHRKAGGMIAVGGSGGISHSVGSDTENGFPGESFFNFSGGAGGALVSIRGGGGGGGAGPYGNGGNGGNGNQVGQNAPPNSGAGGGGGGGVQFSGVTPGGSGGSGRVILWLFTKA